MCVCVCVCFDSPMEYMACRILVLELRQEIGGTQARHLQLASRLCFLGQEKDGLHVRTSLFAFPDTRARWVPG